VDQRGAPRINNGTVDIGSVETGPVTFVVTTLADEDDLTTDPTVGTGTSLREALTPFLPGQTTITFAPGLSGTISLTRGILPQLVNRIGLKIIGPGAGLMTIDASAIQGSSGGILYITGGNCTISGLTFANGTAADGGAIFSRSDLTLVDCSFVGNSVQFGGGAIYGTSFSVTGCTFLDNFGGDLNEGGGAIFSSYRLSVTNSTFTGNSASFGGAISIQSAHQQEAFPDTPTITNSTFSENTATDDGGAIYNDLRDYSPQLKVTGSTFYDNSAGHRGGGIYSSGILSVVDNTLYENSAANVGNLYPAVGGGIDIGINDDFLTNYTILSNNIIAGSTLGLDIYRAAGSQGIFSGNYNLVGDGSGNLPNTITGNPLLGPLQDNGGPTWTMAPLTGSPAIDAGSYDALPPSLSIPTGVTLTVQPGGGGLPAQTTFTYRVSAITLFGETLASSEVSITTGNNASNAVTISWDPVPGATGYKIYGRIQGAEVLMYQIGGLSQFPNATSFVDNAGWPLTTPPPWADTTARPTTDQRGLTRVIGNAMDIGAVEMQTPQLVGDYNRNGTVDAADYVLLRNSMGATGVTPYSGADGDGDGVIGQGDYNVWRSHFGNSLPAPAAGALSLASQEMVAAPSAEASSIATGAVASSISTSAVAVITLPLTNEVSEPVPGPAQPAIRSELLQFANAKVSEHHAGARQHGPLSGVGSNAPLNDNALLAWLSSSGLQESRRTDDAGFSRHSSDDLAQDDSSENSDVDEIFASLATALRSDF
jgi:predicted outer membrane repeat protein